MPRRKAPTETSGQEAPPLAPTVNVGAGSGAGRKNPICDLIDDKTFARLYEAGLLNEIAVRNLRMKKRFADLKNEADATGIIADLARQYYRSFSQVRKIIYTPSPLDELVSAKKKPRRIKR